jgi:hypothetical protein
LRSPADEPFGMGLAGDIENGLAFRDELGGLAVMNGGRSQQLQSRMMVLMVVPGEKVLTETARVLDGAETIRVTSSNAGLPS